MIGQKRLSGGVWVRGRRRTPVALLTGASLLVLTSAPAIAANLSVSGTQTTGQAVTGADDLTVTNTGDLSNVSGSPAVFGSTGAGTILNNGKITGAGSNGDAIGITGDVTAITNNNTITANGFDADAIEVLGNVGTITNNSTIRADGVSAAGIEIGALGVGNGRDVTDFTNTGTISTSLFNAVYIHGKVLGTFDNTGTITAATDDAVTIVGTTHTFTNSNKIINTGEVGISFGGRVDSFTNNSSISSTSAAVVFGGGVTSATNNGTIIETGSTTNTSAVIVRSGASSFTNNGTISGVNGLFFDSTTTQATVINTATITATGAGAKAIQLSTGDDTLTLFTGSTTTGIVDGAGNSSATGDTLILDGTTSGSFSANTLTNFERITKQGTGSWSLSGDNAATMPITIDAGLLSINGIMSNSNVTVNAGTLGGNGTVGTVDVHAAAHVAPGNSVGTLHTGAIVFANDSVYDVEVAGSTADKIVASGTAFIGSNVTVNVTGTPASCGNLSLPILTSTGRTGTFTLSTLLSNVSLSYDATSAYLNITNGVGRVFSGFTNTPNQASTAAALDAMGCASQPYSAQLAALTDAQVPAAMDALSGEGHAGIAGALVEGSHTLPGVINDRIEQAFAALDTRGIVSAYGAGPMLIDQIDGLTVWGAGYGGLAARAGDGNAAGWQSGASGFVLGADGKVNEDVRLGALGGIGVTGISAQAMQGTSTDASVGLYGGGQFSEVTIKAGLLYTRHLIQTSRSIVFPGVNDTVTASYQAGTAQLYFELSHDFAAYGMTFTPFARFNAVNHATDAFTETGGQGQLATQASVVNALFVTLGVSAEDKFVLSDRLLVTARGSVGWRHAFADAIGVVNSFAGGGPFTVAGAGIAGDAAVIEASAVLDLSETTSLKLGYGGLAGSGLASGAVTATFAGKF